MKNTKHKIIQIVRRLIQLGAVAVILSIILLSLYANFREVGALESLQIKLSPAMAKIMAFIDKSVYKLDNPDRFLDWFKGTAWSVTLFGMDISDPLSFVEVLVTSKAFYLSLFLAVLAPLIITLLLGRVFCSWLCPAYLVFEINGKVRAVLQKFGLVPGNVKFSWGNKYLILGAGLAVAAFSAIPFFVLIYPPAVLSRLAHGWIFGTAVTGTLLFMVTVMAFELLVSPRWWCRTVCPGGALYGLAGSLRVLRVRLDGSRCTSCGKCRKVCEEGLDPVKESRSMECDNCGVCCKTCPERALSYGAELPGGARDARE